MLSKMFPKDGQTVPEIRLDGFEEEWGKDTLEPYLTESRISGDTGLTAKKITVKLWGKGVIEKEEKYAGSSNTQYFIRKGGQFIYSKLDFQNQAFGIIPNELNGYQSTLDLPTFDIQNIDSKFLLEYVMRREFYEYQGLIANGSRKAKRIHPEDFLVMPVRIPSIEEQQAIGAYFSNLDNLINFLERLFLSFSSFFPGLILFIFTINIFPNIENLLASITKIIILILVMLVVAFGLLKCFEKEVKSDTANIVSIQPVEHEIIPTYIGLFVIMLGLGSLSLIYQMFIVLFIFGIWFVLMEKSYYFNLIWLLKYRYYKVQDEIGNTYIIYSKRNDVKEVGEIQNLVRINNFTFLEKE